MLYSSSSNLPSESQGAICFYYSRRQLLVSNVIDGEENFLEDGPFQRRRSRVIRGPPLKIAET